MGGLKRLRDSLASFDIEEEQKKIVAANTAEIEKLQREQMYQGRGADGEYIGRYSEDPYFKTREAALRYAGWKQKISPHPQRPYDVVNLYINGFYHNSIKASLSGGKLHVEASANFSGKIEAKYPHALGLDYGMRKEFITEVILPSLRKALKEKTGLQLIKMR
jgi:hypothetical protein